jgi:fibro-slime domain-containing protein
VAFTRRQILSFLIVAFATASAHAGAKVIMLFNPWGVDSTVALGLPMAHQVSVVSYYPVSYSMGSDSALLHVVPGTPWLEWTAPDSISVPNTGVSFIRDDWSTYDTSGLGGQGSFNLGVYWATSDTVWIVPSPLPGGPAIISSTAPGRLTVFLWNPWQGKTATAPSLQVQGGPWATMHPVAGSPGWFWRYAIGLTSASLLFRDSVGGTVSYLGVSGVSAAPAPGVYDTAWARGDSIWVVANPEPSGKPMAGSRQPTPFVLEIFNPWDGSPKLDRPLVKFQGDTVHYPTAVRTDLCGWSQLVWYDRVPPSILVSSSVTGQTWGFGGLNSPIYIDLSSVVANHDTVWLGQTTGGAPNPTWAWDGTQGVCTLVELAAIVRDFNASDPSFEGAGLCPGTGYVQSVLGPNRKPIPTHKIDVNCNKGDSLRMANDWFTTDPTYTQSAATCIDIPLQLDSTGNYTYANPNYYPIDTFTTLPNGKPNPFNVQYRGQDGLMHNFNFCMELHGTFNYKVGQKFDFEGDDDVYFFINNLLEVDLGGTHFPESAAVSLDTLKLAVGQSYPWDMFYCERHDPGSSIKISTSMNLRTLPTFTTTDSLLGPSKNLYSLWVSQTNGTSCEASSSRRLALGQFSLTGGNLDGAQNLVAGNWYGGITITPDLGTVTLDSAAIAGLAPGNYVLHIALQGNLSTTKDVPFTVPPPPLPKYLSPVPDSSLVGTAFPVQVVATLSGAPDSVATGFTFVPPAGISMFLDSLLAQPLPSNDTLYTNANGRPVRLWAKGIQPGSWNLILRTARGDSTDVWPFAFSAPLPLVPKYLNPSPYSGPVGTAAPLDVMTTQGGKRDTAGVAFTLVPPAGLSLFGDSLLSQPITAGTILRTGPKGQPVRIWAEGVQVGSWTLALRDSVGDSVDVSPSLVFSGRGIRFTDATWTDFTLGTLTADVDQAVPVFLEAYLGNAFCSTCTDDVSLTAGNAHLRLLASPTGPTISSIALVGGKAEFWAISALPIDSTSIAALSDSSPLAVHRSVHIAAPRLVFVDSSGTVFDSVPPLNLAMGQTERIRVEVLTGSGLCSACVDSLTLSASSDHLLFQDTLDNPITRLDLSDGTASFLVSGWAPVRNASFIATTDSLRAQAAWSPVSISAPTVTGLLMDSDADGRADLLSLQLPVDASEFQGVRVEWPDTDGVMQTRTVPLSATGKSVSVPLPPFAFGATSCPAAGCANLGQMEIVHGRDTAWIPFAVRDGVVPVIVDATLRYASSASILDTLRVRVSEPLLPHSGLPWVSWGRASIDSLGTPVDAAAGGPVDNRDLYFLVDSTFLPDALDSIRLTASPTGAAGDTAGNVPLRFAHWAPVERGPFPPNLSWIVRQGFHAGNGTSVTTDPDLQILTRNVGGSWTALGGTATSQDTSAYTGLEIHLSTGVAGAVFVYDNLGVFVAGMSIPSVDKEISQGLVPTDSRGNAKIWLAWDGRSRGKAAPDGVYLMRVLLTSVTNPPTVILNKVFPLALVRVP